MNNLNTLAEKYDEKIKTGSQDDICALVEEVNKFTSEELSSEKRCCAHYLLGNLHGKLALLFQEDSSSWQNNNSDLIIVDGDLFHQQLCNAVALFGLQAVPKAVEVPNMSS